MGVAKGFEAWVTRNTLGLVMTKTKAEAESPDAACCTPFGTNLAVLRASGIKESDLEIGEVRRCSITVRLDARTGRVYVPRKGAKRGA